MGDAFPIADMLTMKESAARLGVTPRTVRAWAKAGKLRVYRLGGRIKISPLDLDSLLVGVKNEEELGRTGNHPFTKV